MKHRAKVYPQKDYYISFLNSRGIIIADKREHALHYFGKSNRELKSLIKKDRPDIAILHNDQLYIKEYDFPFIYDPINTEKDIYNKSEILTNNYELAKLYYRKLALAKSIRLQEVKLTSQEKSIISKLIDFMVW